MEGDENIWAGVMLRLMLLLFWFQAPTTAKRLQTMCVFKDYIPLDQSYYRPGDIIIGGNLPLGGYLNSTAPHFNTLSLFLDNGVITSYYQQFLALRFAISQVNKDFLLLPNITLGFHIYCHFQGEIFISLNSLSMLSSQGQVVPGYKCGWQDILFSIIGGLNPKSSRLMDSIFSIFKVPQFGVGFEFSQVERRVYPSFFRINPRESSQYMGLIHLLLYFQWNWVGLVAPEDDRGERFISTLTPMLNEKEICLAFSERVKSYDHEIMMKMILSFKTWSKIEVILLFGDYDCIFIAQLVLILHEKLSKTTYQNVWIITSHWKLDEVQSENTFLLLKIFHGALHFRDHSRDVSEFNPFVLSLDPLNPKGDVFLPLWWKLAFGCKIHKSGKIPPKGGKLCTGKEKVQNLPNYIFETSMTGESYNIYNAVYAVAHALHAMFGSRAQPTVMKFGKRILNIQSWQVIYVACQRGSFPYAFLQLLIQYPHVIISMDIANQLLEQYE